MNQPPDQDLFIQDLVLPETPEPGQNPAPWVKTNVVGKALPRVDGYEIASGTAQYPSDVGLPGMLYGAVLRCPYPNAMIKEVDITTAVKLPGVHSVIGPASPEADLKWPYKNGVDSKIFDRQCRFEGDAVAAVAADTPYHAWDAVRAIEVKYQILPFVADEKRALGPKTPAVHPSGNRVGRPEVYKRGDVEKGFTDADVVLESEYRTQSLFHTPLEPHGCVARWDGDRLTVWESTQGVFAVQKRIAEVLKMPLSKVRVIGRYMGGGFGSKLDAGKYTIIAALLARNTGRAVKLFLTGEETFLVTGNRPPANMKLKAGVKKDGSLTALDFTCLATGGAYPSGGTQLVDWLIRDLYKCPNVRSECTDVCTNAGPARPFRAPGHPQGAWALEQMMDSLAEALGMDPVELRLKNIAAFSQARQGNPHYTSTGYKECLEAGASAFEWKEKRKRAAASRKSGHIKTGVGMAGCLWFIGGGWPPATVILKLFSDGSANLNMGASDIGTGTRTVMAMVVAEELGLNPSSIQIENADTATTQYASPSGGSKTVPTEAPAVRAATVSVKQQLLKMAAEDLKTNTSNLTFNGAEIVSKRDRSKKIKIGDLSGFKKQGVIIGIGHKSPNPENKAICPFGAQFCEVRVNTLTGEIEIVSFLAAHDSGRIMNSLTYDNQVFGGITMGIGFGTTEMRILDRGETGRLCTRNRYDYKVPTALDIPAELVSLHLDMPDNEANSTGAKGHGEPVTIPTAAAIANAVYNATGIRITTTPINPLQLSVLLAEQREKRRP